MFDEVKLYDKALSGPEVWNEYQYGKPKIFDNLQPDGDDIRFTDSNGKTELDFWKEEVNNSVTGKKNYKNWVKVPSIPAGTSKDIYMYYGNTSATSSSDGDNVFEFFDDFTGVSLDTNKWY